MSLHAAKRVGRKQWISSLQKTWLEVTSIAAISKREGA